MLPQYEVFQHEGAFIVVKHYSGQDAGFARAIYDRSKIGAGMANAQKLPHAEAYACAKKFDTEAAAKKQADRKNG